MRKFRENMKAIIIIVVIVFGGTAFYGFGSYMMGGGGGREMPAQVLANVARLNGEPISREEFNSVLQNLWHSQRGIDEGMIHEFKARVLDQIIERRLVLDEARQEIDVSQEAVEEELAGIVEMFPSKEEFERQLEMQNITREQLYEAIEESLLLEKMYEEVTGNIEITEDEIREAYEQVRARHILFRFDNGEEREEVEERAQMVREKLIQGADFVETAREYSEAPSAPEGGDLGFFGRGEMFSEFEEASFALEPGEISELVETDYGIHIIMVEEHRRAEGEEYEEERPEIEANLRRQREQANFNSWSEKLKSEADIEILDPEIRAYNLRREGELEKAITAYHEAIEFNPQNPHLYSHMADVYAQNEDYESAIRYYQEAIELRENPEFIFQLGDLYWDLGDEEQALAHFERSFELAGEDDLFLHFMLRDRFEQFDRPELAADVEKQLDELMDQQEMPGLEGEMDIEDIEELEEETVPEPDLTPVPEE